MQNNNGLEILKELGNDRPELKAVIFDFDGTISTLRQGWEEIMEPLMIEMITGGGLPDDQLTREVKEYIDESTGIQTIFQMQGFDAPIQTFWEAC
jgi:phosphoglycolate phosphatase-like HAD superfamily hydrolase